LDPSSIHPFSSEEKGEGDELRGLSHSIFRTWIENSSALSRYHGGFNPHTQQHTPEACPHSGGVNADAFPFVSFVYLRGNNNAGRSPAQEGSRGTPVPPGRLAVRGAPVQPHTATLGHFAPAVRCIPWPFTPSWRLCNFPETENGTGPVARGPVPEAYPDRLSFPEKYSYNTSDCSIFFMVC
jgi:hypothetical protein